MASSRSTTQSAVLAGQLLIATPGMNDPRFARSVILICAHSGDGAMGLVINKADSGMTFPALLKQLSLTDGSDVPASAPSLQDVSVQIGGPVETNRGFVLHTTRDYATKGAMPVNDDIGLSVDIEILRAIVRGEGPRRALFALGYAGWGPGQLEAEISHNGWLQCNADESLIFEQKLEDRYSLALRKLGVDIAQLSVQAGHA